MDMYKSNGTNYMYQQNQIIDSNLSIAHHFLLKGACSLQLCIHGQTGCFRCPSIIEEVCHIINTNLLIA